MTRFTREFTRPRALPRASEAAVEEANRCNLIAMRRINEKFEIVARLWERSFHLFASEAILKNEQTMASVVGI